MSSLKDIYFPHLDEFAHGYIFNNIEQVWDPLKNLEELIRTALNHADAVGAPLESVQGLTADSGDLAKGILVEHWIKLDQPVVSEVLGIWIGEGTVLEPTAIIKGPTIIGRKNDIRQGAYLRGNVLAGDRCVIGHCTEIKNSVLMNHVEAGHFNYIGDSILGSYVNLGAGSRLANVQFRSLKEKQDDFIHPIEIPMENGPVRTGLSKLGGVLGDNVEVGCNAVICPGTLVGKNNWIRPNSTVPKGFHPPGHAIAPANHKPKSMPKQDKP